ncbi:hypothetical protein M9H77_14734 [Catharanthus roseus]|uniref:Uncharacterized protein n=1 Tax=Catharanthus roseus TaxID=4058 RepID=A0ACC0BP19_CATRO|nr:hypothetical protein M9H77_14734 [Catharanthus roseus]
MGTVIPDDLQLMAIVAGGTSRGRLYRAGPQLYWGSCCLDHEQRLMRRVEDVVSRISAIFDKHMRRLFEHNHLVHIPFPPMMSFVKAAMSTDFPTYLSTAAAIRTSEC